MEDFVLAMDFGGTKIALCTAALDGRVIRSARVDTRAELGAAQALERALERARELTAATPGELAGLAAVSPGVIRDDGVLLAPNVPGWGELALAAKLREGLGTSAVTLDNDVKAATLAELRWGALQGADPALLLNLGTGLAVGVVAGGRVLAGAHGAAGEIGYLTVGADSASAVDGRAPLEELAGGRGLGERASRLAGQQLTAEQAFRHADRRVRALVDEALGELARQLANVAIALDPARVAVGGGLMRSPDAVLPALAGALARAVPFPPELVPARFREDGALWGALALALDNHTRRRS